MFCVFLGRILVPMAQPDETYSEHDVNQGVNEHNEETEFEENAEDQGFEGQGFEEHNDEQVYDVHNNQEFNGLNAEEFEAHDVDQGFDAHNVEQEFDADNVEQEFEAHIEEQEFDAHNAEQELDAQTGEQVFEEGVTDKLYVEQNDEAAGNEVDLSEDLKNDDKHDNATAENDEKRWPGWPGENVFRMLVPAQKVGSIIGRKGEFIKKIVEETKARVKILDGPPGTAERAVSLLISIYLLINLKSIAGLHLFF